MVRHISSHRRSASGECISDSDDKTADGEEDHKGTSQPWLRKKSLLAAAVTFVLVLGVLAIGKMSRAGGVLAMLETAPVPVRAGVDALQNSWPIEPQTEAVPPEGPSVGQTALPGRPEIDPEQVARAARTLELKSNRSQTHAVRSCDYRGPPCVEPVGPIRMQAF